MNFESSNKIGNITLSKGEESFFLNVSVSAAEVLRCELPSSYSVMYCQKLLLVYRKIASDLNATSKSPVKHFMLIVFGYNTKPNKSITGNYLRPSEINYDYKNVELALVTFGLGTSYINNYAMDYLAELMAKKSITLSHGDGRSISGEIKLKVTSEGLLSLVGVFSRGDLKHLTEQARYFVYHIMAESEGNSYTLSANGTALDVYNFTGVFHLKELREYGDISVLKYMNACEPHIHNVDISSLRSIALHDIQYGLKNSPCIPNAYLHGCDLTLHYKGKVSNEAFVEHQDNGYPLDIFEYRDLPVQEIIYNDWFFSLRVGDNRYIKLMCDVRGDELKDMVFEWNHLFSTNENMNYTVADFYNIVHNSSTGLISSVITRENLTDVASSDNGVLKVRLMQFSYSSISNKLILLDKSTVNAIATLIKAGKVYFTGHDNEKDIKAQLLSLNGRNMEKVKALLNVNLSDAICELNNIRLVFEDSGIFSLVADMNSSNANKLLEHCHGYDNIPVSYVSLVTKTPCYVSVNVLVPRIQVANVPEYYTTIPDVNDSVLIEVPIDHEDLENYTLDDYNQRKQIMGKNYPVSVNMLKVLK